MLSTLETSKTERMAFCEEELGLNPCLCVTAHAKHLVLHLETSLLGRQCTDPASSACYQYACLSTGLVANWLYQTRAVD